MDKFVFKYGGKYVSVQKNCQALMETFFKIKILFEEHHAEKIG